jgi:hypothetical protein
MQAAPFASPHFEKFYTVSWRSDEGTKHIRNDHTIPELLSPSEIHLSLGRPVFLGNVTNDRIERSVRESEERADRSIRLDLDILGVHQFSETKHVGCVVHVRVKLDLKEIHQLPCNKSKQLRGRIACLVH